MFLALRSPPAAVWTWRRRRLTTICRFACSRETISIFMPALPLTRGFSQFQSPRPHKRGPGFGLGTIVPPPPVTMACTASPVTIFPATRSRLTATAAESGSEAECCLQLVRCCRIERQWNLCVAGLGRNGFAGSRHLYGEGRSEGRQARQGRPEARRGCHLLSPVYGEGI